MTPSVYEQLCHRIFIKWPSSHLQPIWSLPGREAYDLAGPLSCNPLTTIVTTGTTRRSQKWHENEGR
ncbi:hypothetical protein NC653_041674 [Populus alba x Populus x berolinensis]|uniref:Uncharacterized protein n=1 Tax=Populus alba x Populus x berolinensis TaxID=444605 RepID=A0AAD6LAQ6_9ROSI|nr:hypothetical protein NC653_041674 [Populus alba x Populus x berolinensis]